MRKFRVAVLANIKANAPAFEGMSEDQWDDLDSESTVLSFCAMPSAPVGTNVNSSKPTNLSSIPFSRLQTRHLFQYCRRPFRRLA